MSKNTKVDARQNRKVMARKSILPGSLGSSPNSTVSLSLSLDKNDLLMPAIPHSQQMRLKMPSRNATCYQLSSLNENKTKQVWF